MDPFIGALINVDIQEILSKMKYSHLPQTIKINHTYHDYVYLKNYQKKVETESQIRASAEKKKNDEDVSETIKSNFKGFIIPRKEKLPESTKKPRKGSNDSLIDTHNHRNFNEYKNYHEHIIFVRYPTTSDGSLKFNQKSFKKTSCMDENPEDARFLDGDEGKGSETTVLEISTDMFDIFINFFLKNSKEKLRELIEWKTPNGVHKGGDNWLYSNLMTNKSKQISYFYLERMIYSNKIVFLNPEETFTVPGAVDLNDFDYLQCLKRVLKRATENIILYSFNNLVRKTN